MFSLLEDGGGRGRRMGKKAYNHRQCCEAPWRPERTRWASVSLDPTPIAFHYNEEPSPDIKIDTVSKFYVCLLILFLDMPLDSMMCWHCSLQFIAQTEDDGFANSFSISVHYNLTLEASASIFGHIKKM